MKNLLTIVATIGMLAFTACGPSEEERRLQDSLSEKNKDSAGDALFDEALKDLEGMTNDSKKDSLLKDSLKQDSIKKAAQPKK